MKKQNRSRFLGTDDASLVERIDEQVVIVEGNYDNIKFTTPGRFIILQKRFYINRQL